MILLYCNNLTPQIYIFSAFCPTPTKHLPHNRSKNSSEFAPFMPNLVYFCVEPLIFSRTLASVAGNFNFYNNKNSNITLKKK